MTRRTFDKALEAALEQRDDDEGTSLIVLDVDWFKTVNDRFGHPCGDEALTRSRALLVAALRRGDVVCRLGGDEMAILMPVCPLDVARRRAEDIVIAVREHGFNLSVGNVINLSISVGLAHGAHPRRRRPPALHTPPTRGPCTPPRTAAGTRWCPTEERRVNPKTGSVPPRRYCTWVSAAAWEKPRPS